MPLLTPSRSDTIEHAQFQNACQILPLPTYMAQYTPIYHLEAQIELQHVQHVFLTVWD